jgi:outer membrane protein insertion porin family
VKIEEGVQFYIRNINWTGNTKYTDEELNKVFRLKKGEVYNQKTIDTYMFREP